MKFEDIEQYIDSDFIKRTSEMIYAEHGSHKMAPKQRVTIHFLRIAAVAACMAVMILSGAFRPLTAAARNLAVYLFGGTVAKDGAPGYYMLSRPVTFGKDRCLTLELAYRDGSDVYAVISAQDGLGIAPASLKIGTRTYEDANRGNNVFVRSNQDADGTSVTEYSEGQFHFTEVQTGTNLCFKTGGEEVSVTLEEPGGFGAGDTASLSSSGILWTLWPLSADNSVLGNSAEFLDSFYEDSKITSIDFSAPYFTGESGASYPAVRIGERNRVWKPEEKIAEQISAFSIRGVSILMEDYDDGLFTCTFPVPERGDTLVLDQVFKAGGLQVTVKCVERSERDTVTLHLNKKTTHGEISGMSVSAEDSTGYGLSSGDNEFQASVNYIKYLSKKGNDYSVPFIKEEWEEVNSFPYQTGDEMSIIVQSLELTVDDPSSVKFVVPFS